MIQYIISDFPACTLVFPACIVNGTAVSKTFQILYKNEEVILDDIIIFKVHALVEGDRVSLYF